MLHALDNVNRGRACLITMLCVLYLTVMPLHLAADGLEAHAIIVVINDAVIDHSNLPAPLEVWRVVQDSEQDNSNSQCSLPCCWNALMALVLPCRVFRG